MVIHSMSRGAGEILMGLEKWNSLYMTGLIEPYYYPRLRDRVYRRTILVARDQSALAASSVGEYTEGTLSLLTHDPGAVRALEGEFMQYLSMCRPLMQIFNAESRERFERLMERFYGEDEETLAARPGPGPALLEEKTVAAMEARCGEPWLRKHWEKCRKNFRRQLDLGHNVTEILHLPDPELVRQGKLQVPMWDFFGTKPLFYRPEELISHLEQAILCLENCKNYRIVFSSEIPENEIIRAREDLGAMAARTQSPCVVFGISEQRLTSAVWEALSRIAETGQSRKKTLALLERYVELLKEPEDPL